MSKLQYHKSEQRAVLTGLLSSLHRVNLQDKFPRIAHGALTATLTVTLSLPVTAVLQTINTEHACIVASQPEMQDNGTLVGSRQPGHVCGLRKQDCTAGRQRRRRDHCGHVVEFPRYAIRIKLRVFPPDACLPWNQRCGRTLSTPGSSE